VSQRETQHGIGVKVFALAPGAEAQRQVGRIEHVPQPNNVLFMFLSFAQHLIAEVPAQFCRCAQVNLLPVHQCRQLDLDFGQVEVRRARIGLELHHQVDVAVRTRSAFEP